MMISYNHMIYYIIKNKSMTEYLIILSFKIFIDS